MTDMTLHRAASLLLAVALSSPAALAQGAAQGKSPRKRPSADKAEKAQDKPSGPAPMAVLNNPASGYLSGEVSVDVRANENPIIRLGLAQNGVTLVEFPSADRFFALHPGNSELVTIDDSPTKATDRFFVIRAGSAFLPPPPGVKAEGPAASIVAQMQSGMTVTFLLYPVRDITHNAHRCVVNYNRDAIVAARRAMGLAVNLGGGEEKAEAKVETTSIRVVPTPQPAQGQGDERPVPSVAQASAQPTPLPAPPLTPAPTPTAAPLPAGKNVETDLPEPALPPVERRQPALPVAGPPPPVSFSQKGAVQNLTPQLVAVSVSDAPAPPPPPKLQVSATPVPAAVITKPPATGVSESTLSARTAPAEGQGREQRGLKREPAKAGERPHPAEKGAPRAKKADRAEVWQAKWSKPVHGLSVAAETAVIDAERRVVYVAVRNSLAAPVRVVPGQPELQVATVDEKGRVLQVEPVRRLGVEASTPDGMIAPGATATFAIAFEAPLLGAKQRLTVAVAQTNAADEPVTVDLVPQKR